MKPENVPDEELRLMALNSLARADDQRAIPMLEKIVNGTGSPRLKERALYVLAQNGSPEARQIVIRIARGGNPDLQARAVQHLGAFGGPESKQALLDIFKSTTNVTVKRNILRSFQSTGDRAQLLEVARTEPLPELRAEAVQQLGSMGAQEQLMQLYSTEKTIEVRRRIIQAMFQRHNPDVLIQLLKTETDPELRRSIVQNLGQMGSAQGTAALQSLYASEKDENVKRAVIDAFAQPAQCEGADRAGAERNGSRDETAHCRAAGTDENARSDRLLHGNSGAAMKTRRIRSRRRRSRPSTAFAQQPNFVNARVVARAAQPDVARAIAAIVKAQVEPAWIGYAVPALNNDSFGRDDGWSERCRLEQQRVDPATNTHVQGPDSARAGSEPDGAGARADE